jgi:hypothetical protein
LGAWNAFFSGQLTAAAAFAGLLFVSLSVNQKRILEVERLADRGLEALALLLLVVLSASAALVPGQPLRLVGGEIGAIGLVAFDAVLRLQRLYMPATEEVYRRRAMRLVWMNRVAVGAISAAGVLLLVTGDARSLYLAPVGMLLAFVAAGMSAWVLLIEINR